MKKKQIIRLAVLLPSIALGSILFSCSSNNKGQFDIADADTTFITDLDEFKADVSQSFDDIASNIASPVEIAYAIKNGQYEFTNKILLDVTLSDYITARDKALILGGLGSDLMYINFYEKSAVMLGPLDQIRQLSNDLYVSEFFDFETLQRLAKSELSERELDSMIFTTTYSLNNMESYLLTAKRAEIGVYMVLGSWTESLYLLSYYANKYKDEKIHERVADQKMVMGEMLKLLNKYGSNKHIQKILQKITPVKEALNDIEFEYEDFGKPRMVATENGDSARYQQQVSFATISTGQVAKITEAVNQFRKELFKL